MKTDLYEVMINYPAAKPLGNLVYAACGKLPDRIEIVDSCQVTAVWIINGFRRAVGLRARLGKGATMKEW